MKQEKIIEAFNKIKKNSIHTVKYDTIKTSKSEKQLNSKKKSNRFNITNITDKNDMQINSNAKENKVNAKESKKSETEKQKSHKLKPETPHKSINGNKLKEIEDKSRKKVY